jgi:hypothetical protein
MDSNQTRLIKAPAYALLPNECGYTLLRHLNREGRKLFIISGVLFSPEPLIHPYVMMARLEDRTLLCYVPPAFNAYLQLLGMREQKLVEPIDWISLNDQTLVEIPSDLL